MKAQFVYDPSKHMAARHYSACCDASLEQRMLFKQSNGKIRPLSTEEFVKRRSAEFEKRNWATVPGVIFRYFCTDCGEQNDGAWEFDTNNKEKE